MAKRKHNDVEFSVHKPDDKDKDKEKIYKYTDHAIDACFSLAASTGTSILDVLVYSEKGAEQWGGDDAVERYKEDPDASVFERYEISINCIGRVP